MKDFYKPDENGNFTVTELISYLLENFVGDEQCSGIGGGNRRLKWMN